jgi:hypothetical protein
VTDRKKVGEEEEDEVWFHLFLTSTPYGELYVF